MSLLKYMNIDNKNLIDTIFHQIIYKLKKVHEHIK